MKSWIVAVLGLMLVAATTATAGVHDPIFLKWLDPANPRDRAIRVYWEKAEAGNATATQLIDLGTMLFERGYPKDAERMYKRAAKLEPDLPDPWFRTGLVRQSQGHLRSARRAYRKCLKILTGHGWCNFYMGRACEQDHLVGKALYYYGRAFQFAPELADPKVNPEVLRSRLMPSILAKREAEEGFEAVLPMGLLGPDEVAAAGGEPQAQAPPEPQRPAAAPPAPRAAGQQPQASRRTGKRPSIPKYTVRRVRPAATEEAKPAPSAALPPGQPTFGVVNPNAPPPPKPTPRTKPQAPSKSPAAGGAAAPPAPSPTPSGNSGG